MASIQDIAASEKISDQYIGRMIRLAYLAPEVLEVLVAKRRPPAISINEMVEVARLPWADQKGRIFCRPFTAPDECFEVVCW